MRIPHHPEFWGRLRAPTPADPLRVLVSGCIAGLPCGVDGTDYGVGGCLADLLAHPCLISHTFCPEETGLGTPRGMPDIHGGDGFSVLDGLARVLDEHGNDMTEGMLEGARAMAAFAREQHIELALLTDMSAACGSQVISDGSRFVEDRAYRRGSGVASALLQRQGVPVASQRDYRTLECLRAHIDTSHVSDVTASDHHESTWFREYFR